MTSAPLARSGAASGMPGTARLTGQSPGARLLGIDFSAAGVREGGTTAALALAALLATAAAALSMPRLRSE